MPNRSQTKAAEIYDIGHAKSLLEQVADRLRQKNWFDANWVASVHYYPPAPQAPESVSMHVYKVNWYNDDRQGIHFETHLGPEQVASKSIPVMLHLFHHETVPGTKIKRITVSKPFVDDVFATVSFWENYAFRVGKYGTQPFTCKLKFSSASLVDKLDTEFERMCTSLGPSIDATLAAVIPGWK